MTGLLFLLVVGLLIWIIARKPTDNNEETNTKVFQVNQQWMDYVAAQRDKAADGAEKKLLNTMLQDLQQQGMPMPSFTDVASSAEQTVQIDNSAFEPAYQPDPVQNNWQLPDDQTVASQMVVENTLPDYIATQPAEQVKKPLDNVSILLYFSAFLVVVAAGLFIAFGDVSGGVKTFTIAIVTAFLYCFGFWLWYSKLALRQAGLTFIGMGIVIAPLIGVAAYTYIFRQSGSIVWLLTSLTCFGLYAHAMWVLKNPLLEYVLIGTFVSLFESAVSVIDLPIYYYGWAFAFVGLIMQLLRLIMKKDYETTAPTVVSSNILIPLSMAVSLWMIPEHGWTQLGVSLLLGSVYYGTLIWRLTDDDRNNAAVASHVMALSAVAVLVFGMNESLPQAALSLVILSLPQVLLILFKGKNEQMIQNFATILLLSLVAATFIAWQEPKIVLIASIVLAITSIICWLSQRRAGCYQLAVGALIAAILDVSFRIVGGDDMALLASVLVSGLLGAQVVTLYFVRNTEKDSTIWRTGFQALAMTTLMVAIISSIFTTHTQTILLITTNAILLIPLVIKDSSSIWSLTSSLIFVIPFIDGINSERHWLATVVIALLWNIALIYFYRKESNRGMATIVLLLLPIAVGRIVTSDVNYNYYSVAYFVLVILFLVARWLAIKQLKPSDYGISYATGYILATIASIAASAYAWHWLPAIICVGIAGLVWLSATYIEKQPIMTVMIPLLLQASLWMVYKPGYIIEYLCLGVGISLVGYVFGVLADKEKNQSVKYVQVTSLLLMFSSLVFYLSGNVWWPMPWALVISGLTLFHYFYGRGQAYREIAGGVILLGVWTVMHFYGVQNTAIYSHVLTGLFAIYAFWRNLRGEKNSSDTYFILTLLSGQLGIGLWMIQKPQYMTAFLCISTIVSLLGYVYGVIGNSVINVSKSYIQKSAIIMLFVPLVFYLSGNVWWPMPWALVISGLTLFHYFYGRGQAYREIAGGVILLGVWTVMHFYGVRNVQAYSHVLAALFAGYAYWRNVHGDKNMSDQYILLTLATVTIPLVIQALVGKAGDIYGWWLLIEQVVIMLLGMTLGSRLMIRWGLYVALGSVLYQLRNLGWAAVAVLAVFLMSIAIYRLQKHSKDEPTDRNDQNNQ